MPQRAVWWPSRRTLIVADLHLGKAETFQQSGIPVPSSVGIESLARLSRLVNSTQAQRILILGDLLHAPAGMTPAMIDAVARWRETLPVSIDVVLGNHDRRIEHVSGPWGLSLIKPPLIAPVAPSAGEIATSGNPSMPIPMFSFTHAPERTPAGFNWAGHIHPAVVLRGRSERLRLTCFHFTPWGCVLPAFSFFTGGATVRPEPQDRVFVIAEDAVVAIDPPR